MKFLANLIRFIFSKLGYRVIIEKNAIQGSGAGTFVFGRKPVDYSGIKSIRYADFLRLLKHYRDLNESLAVYDAYRYQTERNSFILREDLSQETLEKLEKPLSFTYQPNASQDAAKIPLNSILIQYACGYNIFKGWMNVDILDIKQEGYYRINLLQAHPFESSSFEYAFCEDFIEHLQQDDAIVFLSEVYRTLKPGGVFRVSFPGLEGVLKKHYRNKERGSVETKIEAYAFWDHLHFFSKDELFTLAKHIGFSSCETVEFGKSAYTELGNLDSRKEQIGLNLYAELKK